ncbi:uncharacterized protein BO72DRAFT_248397 [Aspergillus fijiensis CBS 313.89]|uniref:GRF-like zinc ribbon domain-containing protein n=1 Tax=Aspergillus fijiensis CBS 313.89 TaxID=1448319 RepID=A0A8G1RKK7_9EURO|nr:uncharacterized protein BO72DRAFT_248397 [Aspergillus fijiensis CBS 313.89]RAK73136.1 hypothetical protein BO72DRAFT_248397 [Aspergillus fijiensis CBS 313.89]
MPNLNPNRPTKYSAIQMTSTGLRTATTAPTAPQRPRPPPCRRCNAITSQYIVSENNENGNAGRPYYRCHHCGTFACFADLRGVHPDNPACDCEGQLPCRLQVASQNDRRCFPGALFYTCAVGGCNYFQRLEDENGEAVVIFEESIPAGLQGARYMEARGL